ncbi:nitrate- and nitrite sensing domain-containing protein [Micromonospora globbae]|uniref:histidine kinase n=1 Tax=Micromonospora globbae TaxID=1894969 RepID=A0A420F6M5_9ACTN|nr:nitrate- and nitrite sensing domain-containing protein [Micromonospora globbae]RKF28584.1 HAMP domain-containing protein [Micromonospora globbae]
MGSRSTNLRTKVIALLVSLVALWAFAAWVTVRDGFNLLGVQTLNSRVFEPSDPLLVQLQKERRLSLAYLGGPDAAQLEQLAAERRRTDDYAATFRESVRDWRTEVPASSQLEQRIDELLGDLDRLNETRAGVDARNVDRATTMAAYVGVIDSIFRVFDALGGLDDPQIAQETAALIDLNRARELLSQEDALLTGALAAGRITAAEQAQFAHLVGAQRFTTEQTAVDLARTDRERFQNLVASDEFQRFRALEDQIVRSRNVPGRPPVSAADWDAAVSPAMQNLRDVIIAGGEDVVSRAMPVAIGVIVRLVLAAGLGLIAVVASIIVSITTARSLLRQLERLREAAFQLANERLPSVVERLGRGDDVDVAKEAPPLEFGHDEIGQVGKAFNVVQETAIRTAVEQAELRRSVREVFLSLARRTQALVHRQLTLLDAMERREQDAEELEDLFRVDHLATRMRRNAENLIVLSGSTPGRAWRRNVPMVDVIRGAVAEVEDYTRVNVLPIGRVSLAGRAVGDVIHLLAELIENGLSFSPPNTTVEVRGQMVANGFAIEIEDRGLGMSPEDLAAANHRITDRSELNLANASRLGLYVVSRLTERHGVKVQLKESAYGGTTAVVLIPSELVTSADDDPDTSGGIPAAARAAGAPAAKVAAGGPADTGVGGSDTPVTAPAPAGPVAAQPAAPVALAEPPADPSANAETAVDGETLPTRTRTVPPADGGLPTRTRRTPEPQAALDGPTVPTGLPMAVPRPVADAPATGTGGPGAEGGPLPARIQPARTDSGLPVRVRQASIVPELRDDPAATAADDDDEEIVRPPEQVRRMMSSYQSGTRRGRTEAARLMGDDAPEPGPAPDTDEQQAT